MTFIKRLANVYMKFGKLLTSAISETGIPPTLNAIFNFILRTAPEGLATAMCWVTEPEAGMVEEEGGSSCSCIDFGTAA